jgi:hypothetical protein
VAAGTTSSRSTTDAGDAALASATMSKVWQELSDDEADAAQKLGFNGGNWGGVRTSRPTSRTWAELSALQVGSPRR